MLLDLDGQVLVVDPAGGHWVRFVVTRVPASPEKPLRLVGDQAETTPPSAVPGAADDAVTLDELLRVDAWGRSEPVRALALLSTMLPHMSGRRHHLYRNADRIPAFVVPAVEGRTDGATCAPRSSRSPGSSPGKSSRRIPRARGKRW